MDMNVHESTPLPQIAESAKRSSGLVVTAVLIPLSFLLVVILGVFLNRKFRLVSWVRSRMHKRNSTYDEVMIGQDFDDDDPPLR